MRPAPPVLASVALRKELAPRNPNERPTRLLLAALGLGGLGALLFAGPPLALGAPLGGACAALAALGAARMPYAARALAVVAVAGSAMIVVLWMSLQQTPGLEPLVLWLGVTVLSTALLFRAWHRASLLARALVAVGIVICAGWLTMHQLAWQMLTLHGAWQHWLAPLTAILLGCILLLALLAFMDSRSTGACGTWAALLLGWYALHHWSALFIPYWLESQAATAHANAEIASVLLLAPLFTWALCASLAQLLAIANAAPND